ncbi:aminoacyl tRNA synthase complex-interacting multifunctional protein 2-like [Hydractinia symbiolongicarpus]|uniref:aminoacyl tRNA synthase complex-interacting multifunctional protein 2-like n=1 Tax=Hydractinia symbiolongicarpus TaxID=13093 RepID=UPI00254B9784|nr:aminoacyl tRNA synthase complex-interacting multifunctional protein 2-like [Hydractinia symbiolongicarpus]
MAAETTMYKIKPIYDDYVVVDLPQSMYKMKDLHEFEDKSCDMTPEIKALNERQLKMLQDLEGLTKEVKLLSDSLGHKYGDTSCNTTKVNTKNEVIAAERIVKPVKLPPGVIDFVISQSLEQPSLSPVFIVELLRKNGSVVATPTHLHSSLNKTIPQYLLDVTGGLSGRTNVTVEKIVITFVWKNDPFCPSVMYSPTLQTRITGDANIARFLCRTLSPHLYNDDDLTTCMLIDNWLEQSVKVLHASAKEKDAVLKSLNSHLGKNDHLCNNRTTLADIVMLSAIIVNKKSFSTLPKNVKSWFIRHAHEFGSIIEKLEVPSSWK